MAYKISFLSQFQQQMNQMIQPFLTRTGSNRYAIIENDGKKFELFIDQTINQSNNIDNMETEERKYNSNITLKTIKIKLFLIKCKQVFFHLNF